MTMIVRQNKNMNHCHISEFTSLWIILRETLLGSLHTISTTPMTLQPFKDIMQNVSNHFYVWSFAPLRAVPETREAKGPLTHFI